MDSRITTPDSWIAEMFAAMSASSGGVIRCNRHWVDSTIGRDRFDAELRVRGFHPLETGHQFIVVGHKGTVCTHFWPAKTFLRKIPNFRRKFVLRTRVVR